MKIKLKRLWQIKKSIKKLVGQSVRINVAFRLRKFVRAVEDIYNTIDEERNALIKKLGKFNGTSWEIPNNDSVAIEKFNEEFNKLLEEEVEIPDIKVKLNDFEIANESNDLIETPDGNMQIKVPKLNILDISNLEFLFDDEKDIEQNKE